MKPETRLPLAHLFTVSSKPTQHSHDTGMKVAALECVGSLPASPAGEALVPLLRFPCFSLLFTFSILGLRRPRGLHRGNWCT